MKGESYYTIPELVRAYKLSYRTIWNWIKAKELRAIRVKGEIRVSKKDFERLVS